MSCFNQVTRRKIRLWGLPVSWWMMISPRLMERASSFSAVLVSKPIFSTSFHTSFSRKCPLGIIHLSKIDMNVSILPLSDVVQAPVYPPKFVDTPTDPCTTLFVGLSPLRG